MLAPLLIGIIYQVKARFAGRRGRHILQPYWDIIKLLRKDTVISETTSWVFRMGPITSVVGPCIALAIIPFAGQPGIISFAMDFLLFAYLLALPRMGTVLAALDTGSSFEGMGASRETAFGALAEPALVTALLVAASPGGLRLVDAARGQSLLHGEGLLLCIALFILLLVENARMPVDDPNTHLELTMIHEVMVLDHSGPDLAYIQYGAALKLWVYAALIVALAVPWHGMHPLVAWIVHILGTIGVGGCAVGVVESLSARLPMPRVPVFILTATACVLVVLFQFIWGGAA